MKNRWTLSSGLRVAAVLGFALAGTSYLVDGWSAADLVQRQGLWGSATLAMCGLAFFCIKQLQEPTSARVFLGLSAATMPLHFAQLGAATYSYYAGTGGTLRELATAAAIVFALSVPLGLGLAALSRRDAKRLTLWLFTLCTPLILPSRNGDHVALMALADLLFFLALEHNVFRKEPIYATVEGMATRILLAVPSVILLARNFYYAPTQLWGAALCILPALGLLSFVPLLPGKVSGVALGLAMLGLAAGGAVLAPGLLSLCWIYAIGAVPASLLLTGRGAAASTAVGIVALMGCVLANCMTPATWATLLLVPVGTLQAYSAYLRRRLRALSLVGLATGAGLLAPVFGHIHFSLPSLWLPGLIVSALLLLLASLIDRRRDALQRLLTHIQAHFAAKE